MKSRYRLEIDKTGGGVKPVNVIESVEIYVM
jgi:hypothetical protein